MSFQLTCIIADIMTYLPAVVISAATFYGAWLAPSDSG
jgi:hypothetical protein